MTTTAAPRVFLSHSSEDKNRFVLEFATHLRSRGIDVWLDRWEMYPGDSLVDKIFDEGLKSAEAVIVVVSANSVGSKWVREELNAGYVARLNKGTRLIPVILDDVDVPEALKSTVWVSIDDVEDYSSELDRIVAAIFGVRAKPPLGSPPAFQQTGFSIPGLSNQDTHVLKLFCDKAIAKDSLLAINTRETAAAATEADIPEAQFLESAQVLVEHRLLEESEVLAPVPPYFSVTSGGFDAYAQQSIDGYNALLTSVISEIVNNGRTNNHEVMQAVGQKKFLLVEHILHVLESNDLIKISRASSRYAHIHSVSPRLRRLLESGGA